MKSNAFHDMKCSDAKTSLEEREREQYSSQYFKQLLPVRCYFSDTFPPLASFDRQFFLIGIFIH